MAIRIRHLSFELDESSWQAEAVLPFWKGFRCCECGPEDEARPSDGTVGIVFSRHSLSNGPLSQKEIAWIEWFLENETRVSQAALTALLKIYPSVQEQCRTSEEEKRELGELYDEDDDPYLPDIETIDGFRDPIDPHTIFVHGLDKGDGVPYVGYEFDCTWDLEHDLGILMHGERCVEIGGADTAFVRWIAEEDAKEKAE